MRKASDKNCKGIQNTRFLCSVYKIRSDYKILWKNRVEPERPQLTTKY